MVLGIILFVEYFEAMDYRLQTTEITESTATETIV